jgi:tellurite resistance protein
MDNDHPRARLYYLFGTGTHPKGSSWLERFPASLFGIPFGLFGLAGAWRRAAAFGWGIADDIVPLLLWTAAALWAAGLLVYAVKCKRHWASVLREFRHPVQGPLQALPLLATLLAVVHFGAMAPLAWLPVCLAALLLNGVIAYRVFATAAIGQLAPNAVTPALYLPVVGGMLVGAMALSTLGHAGWAAVLFGAGMAGWAVLEARVLNGLFRGPLPEAFRPTIGIELAPPVVAALAAAAVWPELPGMVLGIGIGAAVVPFASVLARYSWWSQVPFSPGFWSFSFPAAAFASVVLEAAHRDGWPIWIGHVVLLTSTVIIGLLALRTLILLAQRKLLPPA